MDTTLSAVSESRGVDSVFRTVLGGIEEEDTFSARIEIPW